MLGAWDALDKETGIHALRYAVSATGVDLLGGVVTRPDGDDLACATEPIASAAVRVGSSWLVAASSGSPLVSCLVGVAKKPTSLVVDRLVWSTPDTVDWTLERADESPGERVIESLAMTPATDGAWLLVGRRGEDAQHLVRVGHDGQMKPEISLKSPGKHGVLKSSLASLANAVLIAQAGVDAPSRLALEVHDAHGAARLHAELDAQGAVASLSTLEAPDERSVLLAWTLQGDDGRLRVARVTCEGAP
jgi:hypothetical protein